MRRSVVAAAIVEAAESDRLTVSSISSSLGTLGLGPVDASKEETTG